MLLIHTQLHIFKYFKLLHDFKQLIVLYKRLQLQVIIFETNDLYSYMVSGILIQH